MFKNMGLKFKIILGSCITLVLMVILGIISINATRSLSNTNKSVDHTHIVIGTAIQIIAAGVDMETGMRGYLLSGKEDFLGPYKSGQKKFYELVASLSKTVDDNPAQVQLLSEVKTNIDAWQKDVTKIQINLRRQIGDAKTMNDMADLVDEAKGKLYFDKFRDQIAEFISRETKLMNERQASADEAIIKNEAFAQKITDTNNWVNHTKKVIATAHEILAGGVDMETGMRGYLITGKKEFLDPYKSGVKKFNGLVASLSQTVNDNPAQVKLLSEVKNIIDAWKKDVTEPMIGLRKKVVSGQANLSDLVKEVSKARGKIYFDKFRAKIATFTAREEKLMARRQVEVVNITKATVENRQLIANTTKWVAHTRNVIETANEILSAAVDMETGMRGYLLAGKEEFLDPYKAGGKKFSELVASLSQTVNDNPAQVKLLSEVKDNMNAWQKNVTDVQIGLRRDIGDAQTMDDMADLVAEARGKKYFDKFREQIGIFIDREQKLMDERKAGAVQTSSNSLYMIVGGVILAIVLALIAAFFTARAITTPLNKATIELKTSSEELKVAVQQQSTSSTEQATATTQISTTMEELLRSSHQIAEATKNATTGIKSANNASTLGKGSLIKAINGISNIQKQVENVTNNILELGEKTHQMDLILQIINELTDQTTILSYNATIEAAGAGESGNRFSAVAEQIMTLANKAKESTKEVRTLIEDIQKSANKTALLTEESIKAVEEGTQSIHDTSEHFNSILKVSEENLVTSREVEMTVSQQTNTIDQTFSAVKNIQEAAEEVKASSGQTLETAEQLFSMANLLTEILLPKSIKKF
ncbi:MAG: hypothetical protein GY710_07830 [Desulfobacteraceae bacterium]|nr:hypothetical protein [Desulfobacteraceae bacterium]